VQHCWGTTPVFQTEEPHRYGGRPASDGATPLGIRCRDTDIAEVGRARRVLRLSRVFADVSKDDARIGDSSDERLRTHFEVLPLADAAEGKKAAHPNSRFTTPASQCPIICPDWEAPEGVAIDAILFGGRRATNVPLVAEQYENAHGVFIGSAVASEVTAAALDAKVGSLRHDPMAMLPFCGYHMADYWSHWLEMQEKLGDKFPKVYQVNWFRKDENGKFIWPGYGDNSRVLDWIVRRAAGEVEAVDGVTGRYPKFEDFNLEGLDLGEEEWAKMYDIDPEAWAAEMDDTEEYYKQFGDKLPEAIKEQLAKFRARIDEAKKA